MSVTTAGFAKAPVSKAILLLTASSSLGFSFVYGKNTAQFCVLKLFPEITRKLQLWRFLTCHFVFAGPSEIIFGLILLYTFRTFERQFGSKKFASALVFLVLGSTLAQTLILAGRVVDYMPSGPYAIIYGLFAQFFCDIPPSSRLSFFGIPLTDKSFMYLLGVQLLFAVPPPNWVAALTSPAMIGLVTGFIYRADFLPFKKLRLPDSICSFCDRYLRPIFSSSSGNSQYSLIGQRARPRGAQRNAVDNGQVDQLLPGFGGFGAPQPIQVDQAAVTQLVNMGFEEALARRTLVACHNNVDQATNRLLDSH